MHGGAGGGVGGPLPGEPKDPWEVRDSSEIATLYGSVGSKALALDKFAYVHYK